MTTFSVIFNAAVIKTLISKRSFIPPYMLLVLNLAFSDFSLALLGCTLRGPGLLVPIFYETSAALMFLCKVAMFLYFPLIVSINNTILLLTFDRYLAISRPLKHKVVCTRKFMITAIIVSWVICCAIVLFCELTVYFGYDNANWYDSQFKRCSLTFTKRGKITHYATYAFFLILPSFLPLFFYGKIISTIRNKMPLSALTKKNAKPLITRKSFLTISIILLVYYISYLPSLILRDIPNIVHMIDPTAFRFPAEITSTSSIAFYISTFTDPIVYGLRSPYLFQYLKKLCGKCCLLTIETKRLVSQSLQDTDAIESKN